MTSTNQSSKFSTFSLKLANDATLTGIAHIPPISLGTQKSPRPLVVGLHGGTCSAYHYDITPKYTSSVSSLATGFPMVSINRPCYLETSSFLPLSGDSTFYKETGSWLHKYILPKLWEEFGAPNSCTGIVLVSHSMAVPPSIIAAALYADSTPESSNYVLSGMVFSGWGAPGTLNHPPTPAEPPNARVVHFSSETKGLMMVSEPDLNCADPALRPLISAQTTAFPIEEAHDGWMHWQGYWTEYSHRVEVPILYRQGEHDWLWQGDQESMEKFQKEFPKCKRFDSEVFKGGPHALEMGWKAQEWYDQVFQFAKEVCS